MQTNNPLHLGVLLDCAWLYTVSLARRVGALRVNHIADLNYGLSEYLVGVPTQLKQQHEIADLLVVLQDAGQIPAGTKVNVNPSFFYGSDSERRAAPPGWLHFYNHHRRHSAIGAPPTSRLNNLPGHHT